MLGAGGAALGLAPAGAENKNIEKTPCKVVWTATWGAFAALILIPGYCL
jgi:hypothetical protein